MALLHDHGIQVNGSFVLGFDHDGPDVFAQTVAWIEENRLECATFHILTPYPGTPLFRQMETEGRLLHNDWSRYDTAHVVFQPKNMTADELAERLRLVLSPSLLASLDLAATAARLAGGRALPGDVVPLQAFELPLASADPPPADSAALAPAGRRDAAAAPAVSPATRGPARTAWLNARGDSRLGGRLRLR